MNAPALRFTIDDAIAAFDAWHANCGPGALAAVTGHTLDEVRPHLVDFDRKHYTNPQMMKAALATLGQPWWPAPVDTWPTLGLVRIQWHGPWTQPGVPMVARYRHTHWIASRLSAAGDVEIFDINCMCVGGWAPYAEWSQQVVPWLLRECEPKATGEWSRTHCWQMSRVPA